MNAFLIGKGLRDYVNGSILQPGDRTTPEFKRWEISDSIAYHFIGKSVKGNAAILVGNATTAADAWAQLEEQFQGKGFHLKGVYLFELLALSYASYKDVMSFNARFNELRQNLAEVEFAFPLDGYILVYLNALQQAFPVWANRQRYNMRQQSIYTPLMLKNIMDDPLDEARCQTEANRLGNSTIAFYGNEFSGKPSRLHQQKNYRNQNSDLFRQQRTAQDSGKQCNHCNRSGHIEEKCWIAHPNLRPQRTLKKPQKEMKKNNEQKVTFMSTYDAAGTGYGPES